MRDPKRIDEILIRLKEVWERYPDLRLCQLIMNTININHAYFIEDEYLIKILEKYYGEK